MKTSSEDKVKQVISSVFNVNADTINNETSPYTIEGWDSLKHMTLVLALEDEFDIKFEEDEIPSLINFDIIVKTIDAYCHE